MKKILIIGDSSALPRDELSFDKTYYAMLLKLSDRMAEISAIANNTSYRIYTDIDAFMYYGYHPDTVILNYGIVDVYPRPYPNKVYRLLSCTGLLPYIDKVLKKTKLYYKLGDLFNFKEVPLKKFKIYSEGIIQELLERKVKQIIIIGIIKPYRGLLQSKKVDHEVKRYNDVYREMSQKYEEVDYIDIYEDSDESFTVWDGYHYSKKASQYLADKIEKLIQYD
jgi:lysophospholipase L1-like esterase